jgi:exopolyphosphatase/guanosine-5'-triphosphate,3'-diphosphate pyrophosphatase
MPFAVIDVGSNSLKMLVSDPDGEILLDTVRNVRLSRGMTTVLQPEPMLATAAAVTELTRAARESGCTEIIAVGTACLRNARNAGEFISMVHDLAEIVIRVLSGEDEARLTFLGAVSGSQPRTEPVTVADMGGGSLEISTGHEYPESMISLPLGAVVLSERFAEIPESFRRERMRDYIIHHLSEVAPGATGLPLICTGGAAATIASLQRQEWPNDAADTTLALAEMENWTERLFALSSTERETLPGMLTNRADIIPAGALVILETMRGLGVNEIVLSHRGLRHGVQAERIRQP